MSIGGPQQGVYGLPKCLGENHKLCDYVRRLLNYGAYVGWIQRLLVQAQYWHDPLAEEEYLQNSLFLADINNQVQQTVTQLLNSPRHSPLLKGTSKELLLQGKLGQSRQPGAGQVQSGHHRRSERVRMVWLVLHC